MRYHAMRGLTMRRREWLALAGAAACLPAGAAGQRIVSVGGALTETLYALGAQDELVGVDTTSLFPAAAQKLPGVGYARTLSAEGVLSLRPSLVVATDEAGPPAVLAQLEAAGVKLAKLESDHRFEGVIARSTRLAELTGRAEAGRALTSKLQQQWSASRERVARFAASGRPAPRVLFAMGFSLAQARVAGRDTAADAMLRYAGAANVFADAFSGYRPLTPEAAIAAAPDVILATEQGLQGMGGVDGVLRLPGLAQTPAGRARRVVSMDILLMLGFGPRLPEAVDQLSAALQPAA